MKVFVDTSGLFAALVRNDLKHEIAAVAFRRLVADRCDLHSTSYVIAETLSLLQRRVGLEAAIRFEAAMRPGIAVRWVDEDLHERAFRRLRGIGRRDIGIVDCASFEAMEESGIRQVLGFDEHFTEAGFELLG